VKNTARIVTPLVADEVGRASECTGFLAVPSQPDWIRAAARPDPAVAEATATTATAETKQAARTATKLHLFLDTWFSLHVDRFQAA
jgi:hypothetical protein